ncbi:MAG TPA: sensor histidine kinase [Candidatus Acidoferrum sp.]|nr:sensor histidine kinase [Candidatus Acidoferrum sp.]
MGLQLQTRLILLSTVLVVACMMFGVVYQVLQAQGRVKRETEAAMNLAWQLIEAVLPSQKSGTLEQAEREVLLTRLQGIEAVRHLDIRIVDGDGTQLTGIMPAAIVDVPSWYYRAVKAPAIERRRVLTDSGEQIVLRSDAASEIAETWDETFDFLLVLLVVLIGFNVFLHIAFRHWLAPMRQILATIEQAGHGNYHDQVPAPGLPELRNILFKLNEMTTSLRSTQLENERLNQLSLQIQENERRKLAQELHDELGQALSAIKAIAWSMQQKTASPTDMAAKGAGQIGRIAADMTGHLRTMLNELRPAILDEMGLVASISTMVEEWNEAHGHCHCELQADPGFDNMPADQQIHLYRIVQAALTNIATHAGATHASVVLAVTAADYRLTMRDNGKGFDPSRPRTGRGLAGMKERCQALGGTMALKSGTGAGVELVFVFPRMPGSRG